MNTVTVRGSLGFPHGTEHAHRGGSHYLVLVKQPSLKEGKKKLSTLPFNLF